MFFDYNFIKPTKFHFIFTIALFVIFRFAYLGFNFSQFIVAGDDFVHQKKSPKNIIINEGQGYDGQFFYRYAHAPLNKTKTAFGVTVDHIEYRIQRIIYPATVWLLSIGGKPAFIPLLLVLTNLLAFIGIYFLSLKICTLYEINKSIAFLSIFLFGAFMSLARDTSELFEVFFFVLAIYAVAKNNILLYVLSIFLAIFSRETSLIAIAPLTLFYGLQQLKQSRVTFNTFLRLSSLFFPFIAIACWKYYLHITIQSEHLIDGSQNLSLPFYGLLLGIKSSINFTDTKHTLETIFWFLYLFWNIWLIKIVLKRIKYKRLHQLTFQSILHLVFICWLTFALFLGHAIYIDDWGFVRIFTLFNMLGFLIIMLSKKKLNNSFLIFSITLLLLTIVRLIIRV